jgi:PAS domain-containing protein
MIQYLKKDGATIWVSESAGKVADNTGKTLYYYGFCIDITAKKIAEQTIMEQEKTYRRLFTTMTQGVMYFDAEGQIVMANPAVEHIFGTPVKDMVGHQPSFRWRLSMSRERLFQHQSGQFLCLCAQERLFNNMF